MVEDICERGIINPLIVMKTPDSGKLYVYIGNQRLAAARELGMETVPCVLAKTGAEMTDARQNYVEV